MASEHHTLLLALYLINTIKECANTANKFSGVNFKIISLLNSVQSPKPQHWQAHLRTQGTQSLHCSTYHRRPISWSKGESVDNLHSPAQAGKTHLQLQDFRSNIENRHCLCPYLQSNINLAPSKLYHLLSLLFPALHLPLILSQNVYYRTTPAAGLESHLTSHYWDIT